MTGTEDEVLFPADEDVVDDDNVPSSSRLEYYDYGGSKGDRGTVDKEDPQGRGGREFRTYPTIH